MLYYIFITVHCAFYVIKRVISFHEGMSMSARSMNELTLHANSILILCSSCGLRSKYCSLIVFKEYKPAVKNSRYF